MLFYCTEHVMYCNFKYTVLDLFDMTNKALSELICLNVSEGMALVLKVNILVNNVYQISCQTAFSQHTQNLVLGKHAFYFHF